MFSNSPPAFFRDFINSLVYYDQSLNEHKFPCEYILNLYLSIPKDISTKKEESKEIFTQSEIGWQFAHTPSVLSTWGLLQKSFFCSLACCCRNFQFYLGLLSLPCVSEIWSSISLFNWMLWPISGNYRSSPKLVTRIKSGPKCLKKIISPRLQRFFLNPWYTL
jgi:hypothetical protein